VLNYSLKTGNRFLGYHWAVKCLISEWVERAELKLKRKSGLPVWRIQVNHIIAREDDIFPDKKPTKFEEKITVYEFKIPQKVNTLLKQCENRLPKEGFYFNTWGENFNQCETYF
jgi:hypothetical protein